MDTMAGICSSQGSRTFERLGLQMTNMIRTGVALLLVTILSASLLGSVSAAPPAHSQGADRNQAGGTFLFGEPGDDRRAQPEQGGGAGCTAASAINSNPPQAAGDNAAFPNENAAPQGEGPFFQCSA